ncbi:hypothetical protein LC593_33550 [Nostoc sp. CHAB 5844]|nr:hypothetical protein [Nostoc sp. CHAB 5844]
MYELINSIVAIWNLYLQIIKFLTNSHYALSYIPDDCQQWIIDKNVILVISIALRAKILMKKNILSGYEKSCGVIVVMEDGSVSVIAPPDIIITQQV